MYSRMRVQIGTAPADKALPLAAHQRQDFEDLVGRLNARVDQNFPGQRNVARLGEESKRKARGQTETVFAIASAPIEVQFQIGGDLRLRGEEGKVGHPLKNSGGRRNDGHAAQAAIGQTQPLLL